VDLGFDGPKYTWCNRQDADFHVKVRLDRAVANDDFKSLFDDCTVDNVITTSSDHYAIKIALASDQQRDIPHVVSQSFKYEAMWRRAPDYKEVLETAWAAGRVGPPSLRATWDNLNRMATMLKDWSRATFGSVRKQIRKLEHTLFYLRGQPVTEANIQEERDVERKLCDLFECEEIMARQRSRVEWLREGDRNTSFFHAKASARRRTNKISTLTRDDGSKCDSQGEIKGLVHEFYENLFSSEHCDSIDAVLHAIPSKVMT
jgi:hypothetical protein